MLVRLKTAQDMLSSFRSIGPLVSVAVAAVLVARPRGRIYKWLTAKKLTRYVVGGSLSVAVQEVHCRNGGGCGANGGARCATCVNDPVTKF